MINKLAYLSHSSPRPKLTHSVADARNVAKKKMMVDNIFFIGSRCCILLYLLCHFRPIHRASLLRHSGWRSSPPPEHAWVRDYLISCGAMRRKPFFLREWGSIGAASRAPRRRGVQRVLLGSAFVLISTIGIIHRRLIPAPWTEEGKV